MCLWPTLRLIPSRYRVPWNDKLVATLRRVPPYYSRGTMRPLYYYVEVRRISAELNNRQCIFEEALLDARQIASLVWQILMDATRFL
jgi:hypothetical protein